jgi:predicted nucleotidyltransferase
MQPCLLREVKLTAQILPILEDIKNRLKVLNPARIILFGSYASGTPRTDSDIDLIVVLDKEGPNVNFRERMADTVAVRRLLADINRDVAMDVLVYNKSEWQTIQDSGSSFSKEILAKGVSLQ